jgi:hypothetical protein
MVLNLLPPQAGSDRSIGRYDAGASKREQLRRRRSPNERGVEEERSGSRERLQRFGACPRLEPAEGTKAVEGIVQVEATYSLEA